MLGPARGEQNQKTSMLQASPLVDRSMFGRAFATGGEDVLEGGDVGLSLASPESKAARAL